MFHSINKDNNNSHYRKALGALLVFDLTRKSTFDNIQRFLFELRQCAEPDCVGYLIGNKTDLLESNPDLRQVSSSEAKNYAELNKLTYYETTALSSSSVTDAFDNLIEGMRKPILYFLDIYQVKLKDSQFTKNDNGGNIFLDNDNMSDKNKNNIDSCSCWLRQIRLNKLI